MSKNSVFLDMFSGYVQVVDISVSIWHLMTPPEPNKCRIRFLVKERAARYGERRHHFDVSGILETSKYPGGRVVPFRCFENYQNMKAPQSFLSPPTIGTIGTSGTIGTGVFASFTITITFLADENYQNLQAP
jgi:hypothetical protein